jgi:hypothetical protein
MVYATSEYDARILFYKGQPYSQIVDIRKVYGGSKYVEDNMDKKEEKKMDLTKKITVTLTEDDIKEIVAEYVARELCRKVPKKDDIELVYGVKYSGPQMDREEHGYLIECRVKC